MPLLNRLALMCEISKKKKAKKKTLTVSRLLKMGLNEKGLFYK